MILCIPIVLLLLIMGILPMPQPKITGYMTLIQEEAYDDNLNLKISESGKLYMGIKQSRIDDVS